MTTGHDRERAHGPRRDGERAARRDGGGERAAHRLAEAGRAVALACLLAAAAACGADGDAGTAGSAGEGGASPDAAGAEAPAEIGQEAGADAAPGPAEEGEVELTTLDVAGHEVEVEIADDEEERRRGLMYRDSLPEDQGMLFVYPEEETLSFYMRNTEIPLDIAFVDQRGYIVDIQQMEPHTEELHESRRPAMYALEMNLGWFEANGVEEGDRIRF